MTMNSLITASILREISNSVDANLEVILNRMKSEALAGEDFYIHEEELTHKQLSIITSFTARLYGRRRSKRMTEKIIENAKKE